MICGVHGRQAVYAAEKSRPAPKTAAGSGMMSASLDTSRVLTLKTYAVLGARLAGHHHPRQGRPHGHITSA
jgi:hypothetical protein